MSSPSPEQLQLLLQLLDDTKIIDKVAVGSIALLVYEHLLTLGEEIDFMWRGRWGLAKLIFIWNRYFTLIACCGMVFLVTLQPTRSNLIFLQIETGISTLIIGTVDLVLMLRVWILYGGGKKLLVMFLLFLGAEVACMVVIQVFAVSQFQTFLHEPLVTGCYALQEPPKYLPLMLVPPLVVSVLMCSLTLIKCRRRILSLLGFPSRVSEPVTELFLRDGTFWFLAVFAIDLSQLLLWVYARATLYSVLIIPSIVIYTILSSRALLNIKHVLMDLEEGRSPPLSGQTVWESPPPDNHDTEMAKAPPDTLSPAPSRVSERRRRLQKRSKSSLRMAVQQGTGSDQPSKAYPKPLRLPTNDLRRPRTKSGSSSIEPLRPTRRQSERYSLDSPIPLTVSHPYPSRSDSFSSHKSIHAHDSRLDKFFASSDGIPLPVVPNYSRPFSLQTRGST